MSILTRELSPEEIKEVTQALQYGWTIEDILSYDERHGSFGMGETAREQWCESQEAARFEEMAYGYDPYDGEAEQAHLYGGDFWWDKDTGEPRCG